MSDRAKPADEIGAYIAAQAPAARPILRKIRALARKTAPGAEEIISYRMPALRLNGILIYYAAFKAHIGVFPPIACDGRLEKALANYRGPKGNLRFPLDEPMPYDLIEQIVALRVRQNAEKAAPKKKRAAQTRK